MDNTFTKKIKQWLDTPKEKRDIQAGATMLLQLSGNRIMFNNIIQSPAKYADILEHELKKYYDFRVQALTKDEVQEMAAQVENIAKVRRLDAPKKQTADSPTEEYRKGKRADHDSLPDEIRALYVENLSIMQKMRELHMQLRKLSTENLTCPDSERYPFLKEIIKLDKRYHSNWEQYDHYVIAQKKVVTTPSAKDESLKALRLVNLYKGKYKKNPTDELKEVILENYAKVISPSDKLVRELTELGLI